MTDYIYYRRPGFDPEPMTSIERECWKSILQAMVRHNRELGREMMRHVQRTPIWRTKMLEINAVVIAYRFVKTWWVDGDYAEHDDERERRARAEYG